MKRYVYFAIRQKLKEYMQYRFMAGHRSCTDVARYVSNEFTF